MKGKLKNFDFKLASLGRRKSQKAFNLLRTVEEVRKYPTSEDLQKDYPSATAKLQFVPKEKRQKEFSRLFQAYVD